MRYGIVYLQNYSIQDTNTLFTFDQIDSEPFTQPDANTVKHFTIAVNFLTPNDPLYRTVTDAVLASKEKALVDFGSKPAARVQFTTPTKSTDHNGPHTTPSVTPPAEDRYAAALRTGVGHHRPAIQRQNKHGT
jgi:hypothetical protein